MNIDAFRHNIWNFREYQDYVRWMSVVYYIPEENVRDMPRGLLIHGYCEGFTVYFCYKYGLPLWSYDNMHYLLIVENMYYDGWNNRGVLRLRNLEFLKTSDEICRSERVLRRMLHVDKSWRTNRIYMDNFHLIDKKQQGERE